MLGLSFWVYDKEDICPSGRLGNGRGLPRTFMKVTSLSRILMKFTWPYKNLHKGHLLFLGSFTKIYTLHLVLPSGYTTGKLSITPKGWQKDRGLSRTFRRPPWPSKDHCEDPPPSQGLHESSLPFQGPSQRSAVFTGFFLKKALGKGRDLPKNFLKFLCSFQDLHECLHSALNSSYGVYDGECVCLP